ncbi:helix-turn-helix transcriptional regulator [Streptomyces globisporus]|uniref:helix-turn-helix transcriptional regulator n=1 Tax=Streptomyces globisporus TaxID=1908 RepID=UPI0036C50FE9
MTEKMSVESLLEEARLAKAAPPPEERLRLREAAGLTRAQVAEAVGVARGTVLAWETGKSDPTPPGRLPYLRLLEGLAELHPARVDPADNPVGALFNDRPYGPAPVPAAAETPATAVPAALTGLETLRGPDGRAIEGDPGPCVRCGVETSYQSTDGRPLHSGAMCQPTPAPAPAATAPTAVAVTAPAPAAAAPPAAAPVSPVPARVLTRPQRRTKSAERAQADLLEVIRDAVREEAERAGGDEEAAAVALEKRAVPDVMDLFAETRAGSRYEYTAYPTLPDILHKPTKKRPDEIWEARPRFRNPDYSMRAARADIKVTALDTNAAYLSSMKCWLPIGRLEHTPGADGVNPKRAGVHLITPAPWTHPDLPDPIGDRDEPGALWVTDATLRLLLRLSGPRYDLTRAPEIHESWTSGATENFLDALRKLLAAARDEALTTQDALLEVYVKSMYSKFVSTMGESDTNRKIYRPDWMHIVRAQAHANLWSKAYKAHQGGLGIVAMLGTDELHVTGDPWSVFTQGRALSQMKVKYSDAKASGEYMVGRTN